MLARLNLREHLQGQGTWSVCCECEKGRGEVVFFFVERRLPKKQGDRDFSAESD